MKKLNIIVIVILSLIITACAAYEPGNSLKSPKTPKNYQGYYKVGKPFTMNGVTYYPKEYSSYKERGMASWYGDKYHGRKTANGEIYNMHDLTAAHNTLPLPSMVKVTNLDNGKSVVVRINDRGPFAKNRLIDLSRGSAEILGFTHEGLTKVEVKLLKDETRSLHKALNLK